MGSEPEMPTDVEALQNLAAEFRRWLDVGPDNQPRYSSGMRPFSTGDLRFYVESLDRVIARTPAPSSLPDVGELKAAAARIKDWLQGMQATDAIELTNKRYSDLWQLLDAALATDGSEDER